MLEDGRYLVTHKMHRSPVQTNLFPTLTKSSSPWSSESSLRRFDLGSYSSSSSSEFGEHLFLFHKLDYLNKSPLTGLYDQITHSSPNLHRTGPNDLGMKKEYPEEPSSVEKGIFQWNKFHSNHLDTDETFSVLNIYLISLIIIFIITSLKHICF